MRSTVALAILVAFTVLAAAAPASADHIDVMYLDRLCVGSEGRQVEADCNVEKNFYLRLPAPDSVRNRETRVGFDSEGVIAPVPGGMIPLHNISAAGATPWSAIVATHDVSSQAADPFLELLDALETQQKREGLDTLESTGIHFRLLCGWDLTQTERLCRHYNPEADPTTGHVRSERDRLVLHGFDAMYASHVSLARDHAPAIELRLTIQRLAAGALIGAPDAPAPEAVHAHDIAILDEPEDLEVIEEADRWDDMPAVSAAPADSGSAEDPVPVAPLAVDPTVQVRATASRPVMESDIARALVAAGAGALLLTLLIALAHRHLTRQNSLENGTRQAVYEAVRARPGVTISDLARTLRLGHATVTYHLRVLVSMNLVVLERVGNRSHAFANGGIGDRAQRLRRILPSLGRARDLLDVLAAEGLARPADVAAKVGMSAPGAYWHLKRLEELGLVARQAGATGVEYRLADGVTL